MRPGPVFRANKKSAQERASEKAIRDRLQVEKPTLDELVRAGECDPNDVMTMGMYCDIQAALQALKRERLKQDLSIGAVAERSGLDRAVVSRLENGKQDNPTVATLMRYAAAIGKRFTWSYEDATASAPARNGKAKRAAAP